MECPLAARLLSHGGDIIYNSITQLLSCQGSEEIKHSNGQAVAREPCSVGLQLDASHFHLFDIHFWLKATTDVLAAIIGVQSRW